MKIARLTADRNAVEDYPLTFADLKSENPMIGWPQRPTAATFEGTRYVLVEEVERPTAGFGETAVEATPKFSNGAWRQVWSSQSITLAEAKKQLAGMAADLYVVKVTSLTPQQLLQSGYSGAIQGRSTYFKPKFDDVATRI